MFLTTKSGRKVYLPTPEEDALINAGIAADEDTCELDEAWFAEAKPAREVLPPELYAALTETPMSVQVDGDILGAFLATGQGWQARINMALRQYIAEHPL